MEMASTQARVATMSLTPRHVAQLFHQAHDCPDPGLAMILALLAHALRRGKAVVINSPEPLALSHEEALTPAQAEILAAIRIREREQKA